MSRSAITAVWPERSRSRSRIQPWLDPAGSRPRPEVLAAMLVDTPPQRSARFAAMLLELQGGLQTIGRTTNEVLLVPGGGTMALEAAIINFLTPSSHAIVCVNGVFGERIAAMVEIFGVHVHRVIAQWGEPIAVEQVEAAVRICPQASAIFVVHVESSTGVANPVEKIAFAARGTLPDLPVIVDAVPSTGAEPLDIDGAGLDVVVFTSGKALGGPIGCCGCLFIAQRMWERINDGIPRYCLDLREIATANRRGMWLRAAPVHALIGFAEAVRLVLDEGPDRAARRHRDIATFTRESLKGIGIQLAACDEVAAATVTVGFVPQRIAVTQLVKRLYEEFGVVIGVGREAWADRAIRLGHMGMVTHDEIAAAVDALRCCLEA